MHMESYYYSGWPLAQFNSAPNSDQLSPFSVPTTTQQTLPLVATSTSDPAAAASLQFGEFPSWPAPIAAEDRAASASKSHSQAEKRRRDRINAQLATLRKLIPMSDKVIGKIK